MTLEQTVGRRTHASLRTPGAWSAKTSIITEFDYLAAGDNLHVVGRNGSGQLVHRLSDDHGATWGAETVIVGSGAFPVQYNGLVVVGKTVHLLTSPADPGGAPQHVDYRRSDDDGATWAAAVRITLSSNTSRRTHLAVKGDFIHVAGYRTPEADTWYFRSTNGGSSFAAGVSLNTDGDPGICDIDVGDGDIVHLVYGKGVNPDGSSITFYRRSEDNGATWEDEVRIGGPDVTGHTTNSQARVRVAALNGVVVSCWEGYQDGTGGVDARRGIQGVRSEDDGLTWSDTFFLTPDYLASESSHNHPNIALVGNMAHLTSIEARVADQPDVTYHWSGDRGLTWSDREVAMVSTATSGVPYSIAATPSHVHSIQEDDTFQYARRRV